MWIGEKYPNMNHPRVEEAAGLEPDILTTTFLFCITMLDDAINETGRQEQIRVKI